MNISRRQFFIGGAAATGVFGAFGGNRFFAAAGFKADGAPKLRFGVVSDIHITKVGADEKMEGWGNNLTFKHTLEWFRSQNVDAVVIAGDMADKGMVDQMEAVAQAWYAVFPDDRYPDGRPIEKVFVMGNHDYHGYLYGDYAAKVYPDKDERVKHVLRSDFATRWKRIFNEDYARFYCKKIKGYTFLGQHWDDGKGMETGHGSCDFGAELQAFLAAKGGTLDPSLPFFYVQHPHPKDTCYGSWAWGHDSGKVTQALSAYPNAIAFSGHSHYSLTDERSVWQGAFTSVGTSSLRYSGMPYNECPPFGYENTATEGKKGWRYDAAKLMRRFAAGDCRQGMLWSVYDDCIVVKRREFLSNLDVGDDWVLPLPSAEPKPFAFAERAKKFRAPSFPAGAKLAVSTVKAKSRGGKSRNGKESLPSVEKSAFKVVVPATVADRNARLYKLEFVAESKDGTKKTKLIMPEGFNHAVGHAKASAPSFCLFARDEFNGEVRFTVTPFNCFGARGTPLVSDWVANT
jgi:3',5'-cyclic AMP phosphodiesterase CpdA